MESVSIGSGGIYFMVSLHIKLNYDFYYQSLHILGAESQVHSLFFQSNCVPFEEVFIG